MSSMIVSIKGLVKHPIILDPGVWIFDDRKINLSTYFSDERKGPADPSIKQLSRAWDEQRLKGAMPQSNQNKVTVDRKDLTEHSLGIALKPFLDNASPDPEAETVTFVRAEGKEDFSCPLSEAENGILGFSEQGKPLKENGPVHFYYGDGSNLEEPVTHITSIILK
ncbi:peptidyl-prolyl cis-trans isomerase [Salipaludibacillus sp. CUR1]|uniref:peptidyl-prolyl cis-trans isomerase n=1 Tax=Salipaludibacillus sp. CUR1 TaxID=2820003 RepID=UPI001E442A2F|nr:peptidyl-prolyl cis-trans isomerase [Salipaludibacillus sp. CUR1]MCE7794744.1 peptidyl-prolyl cis-trans isomerase [Salipaludibacillus sp. CUR1]